MPLSLVRCWNICLNWQRWRGLKKQSKPNLKEIYDLQSSQKLIFLFSQRLKSVFVVGSDIINVMAATSFMVHLRENKKSCCVKWPVDYMVWRERALLGFQSCLCKTQPLWPHAVALVIIITTYLLPAGRGPHPHLLLVGFLYCPKEFPETLMGGWNIVESFISVGIIPWVSLALCLFVKPRKKYSCGFNGAKFYKSQCPEFLFHVRVYSNPASG